MSDDVPPELLPYFAGRTDAQRKAWWRAVRTAYAGHANQLGEMRLKPRMTTMDAPESQVLAS